jgi:outer membrane lipoprotein SlyB
LRPRAIAVDCAANPAAIESFNMNNLNFPARDLARLACVAGVLAALVACSQAPQAPAPATPDAAPNSAATPAPAPAPEAAPAPEPAPAPAPAPKQTVHKIPRASAGSSGSTTTASGTPAPPRTPMTVCSNCGVIEAITPVKEEGKGTAIGVVAGGLAGLAVGNQIGGGNGKTIAKIAGAAGGALLGNKIEKKVRAKTHYEIKVRLDNGTETTVSQDNEPTLAVGAAVQVVDGIVVAK